MACFTTICLLMLSRKNAAAVPCESVDAWVPGRYSQDPLVRALDRATTKAAEPHEPFSKLPSLCSFIQPGTQIFKLPVIDLGMNPLGLNLAWCLPNLTLAHHMNRLQWLNNHPATFYSSRLSPHLGCLQMVCCSERLFNLWPLWNLEVVSSLLLILQQSCDNHL